MVAEGFRTGREPAGTHAGAIAELRAHAPVHHAVMHFQPGRWRPYRNPTVDRGQPPEIAAGLAEHMSDEDLSGREVDVLRNVATGNRNRDIAETLFIAEETVKVHLKHIMHKLGANDRTQAVAIAVRRGIIHL